MKDREPSFYARELGKCLRRAMRANGYSGKYVAEQLGWAQSRVSRLLSGHRGAREDDIVQFLDLCKITGVERDQFLQLHRARETTVTAAVGRTGLPPHLRAYLDYEHRATVVTAFDCLALPTLVQTGDYAQAVLAASPSINPDCVPMRLAAVLGRAGLFSRPDPPSMTFLLHEWLLRTPIGGPDVLVDQLRHLLRLAARPHVAVRVIPIGVGAHAGLAGPFSLLEFGDVEPVLYRAGEETGQLVDDPDSIAQHRRILLALSAAALPADRSRDLIAATADKVATTTGT